MKHSARGLLSILILVCIPTTPAYAQLCTGAPSFTHVTWQTSIGLEFVGGGLRGTTSLLGGRDALFAGGLANAGHSDGSTFASYTFGGMVGSDLVIHKGRRVHFCPIFKGLYTFGPDQGGTVGPLIDVSTFSWGAGGSLSFIARESVTRQIVPTLSLGFAHDRRRASILDQRIAEETENFLTAAFGLGLVFDDQMALTPQITMAFKDRKRVVAFLFLTTLGFDIK